MHTPTIVYITLLVITIGVVVRYVNWRMQREMAGPGLWLLAEVLMGIGVVLMVLRLFLPVWAGITLAHCFLVASFYLSGIGLRRFSGADAGFMPLALQLAVLVAGDTYFTSVLSAVGARWWVLTIVLTPTFVGWLLSLRRIAQREGYLGTSVLFAVALIQLFIWDGTALALLVPGVYVETPLSSFFALSLTVLLGLEIATTYGYILLTGNRSHHRLQQLATLDELTGLLNRRGLDKAFTQACATAVREDKQVAFAIFDLDNFKGINDRYGHQCGDAVLCQTIRAARSAIRPDDLLARLGGDECTIVMLVEHDADAVAVLERVRATVESTPMELPHGPVFVTLSTGVVVAPAPDAQFDALYSDADQALYRAKLAGRNRVESATLEPAQALRSLP